MTDVANPPSAVKTDWYQTETHVVITILLKGIDQNNITLDVQHEEVKLKIIDNDVTHNLKYILSHKIDTDQHSCKVTPSKIEIKLKKLEGIRWEKLEAEPSEECPKAIPTTSFELSGPPPYPTSKQGKDWSLIEKNIKKQEENEKPEGEEALNKLFQDIYSKGTDEVKKAMNKSFLESGGTVLSTNWDDIKKNKVPIKPPDGMEYKKWDK